jgi:hypothetical protein
MRAVRAEDTPIAFDRPEFASGQARFEETIDEPGGGLRREAPHPGALW